MNTMHPTRRALSLLLGISLSAAATRARASVPAVEHYGTVAYQTGGVGIDEAQAMKREARHYPLALEFVEQAGAVGEYSADEQVTIQGAHDNTVFAARAEGPFMLVDLPDGRYRITAVADGHPQLRTVDLSGKPHDRVAFVWPAQEIEPR